MARSSGEPVTLPAALAHNAVAIARHLIGEMGQKLAKGSEGPSLAELPDDLLDFGNGRLLGWQAIAAFFVNALEFVAVTDRPEACDQLPEVDSVGLVRFLH